MSGFNGTSFPNLVSLLGISPSGTPVQLLAGKMSEQVQPDGILNVLPMWRYNPGGVSLTGGNMIVPQCGSDGALLVNGGVLVGTPAVTGIAAVTSTPIPAASANTNRTGINIQNQSTSGNLWVYAQVATPIAADQTGFKVLPGLSYKRMAGSDVVPVTPIWVMTDTGSIPINIEEYTNG